MAFSRTNVSYVPSSSLPFASSSLLGAPPGGSLASGSGISSGGHDNSALNLSVGPPTPVSSVAVSHNPRPMAPHTPVAAENKKPPTRSCANIASVAGKSNGMTAPPALPVSHSFPALIASKLQPVMVVGTFQPTKFSLLFPDTDFNCYRTILPWVRLASENAHDLLRALLPETGPIVAKDFAAMLGYLVFAFDLKTLSVPRLIKSVILGYNFIHFDAGKLINVFEAITTLSSFDGFVGAIDAVGMIDTAANVGAVTIAANEASGNFRDSLNAYTKVTIILSPEECAAIRRERFNVHFTPKVAVTNDHPLLAASREIIRHDYEYHTKLKATKRRTLILGATAREFSMYHNNPMIYFQIANRDGKDIDRLVVNALEQVRAVKSSKLNNQKLVHIDAINRARGEIKSMEEMLYEWKTQRVLPNRFLMWEESQALITDGRVINYSEDPDVIFARNQGVCGAALEKIARKADRWLPMFRRDPVDSCTFDVVIFEDVGYNWDFYDWYLIFKNTGAVIGYGYMCLPWELLFHDVVPSVGYSFKIEGKNAKLAYHGYSNGYCHNYDAWRTLMLHPVIVFKDIQIGVEIISRVGPMACVKLYRTCQTEIVVRMLSLPKHMQTIKLLNITKSMTKMGRVKNLKDLKYFSVRKDEFYDALNYALDIAPESLSFRSVLLFIRRKHSGMSLVSKDMSKTWTCDKALIPDFAMVVYLYATRLQLKFKTFETDIRKWSYWTALQTTFSIFAHLKHASDWLRDMFTSNSFLDLLVKESLNEFWQERQTKTTRTPVYMYVGHNDEDLLDPDKSFDEMQREESSDCMFCEELKLAVGTQKFTCDRTKKESFVHEFGLTTEELVTLKNSLSDVTNDPIGLKTVKEAALKKLPAAAFSHPVRVRYICGPPGTGKSHAIRGMASSNDIVVAPFSRLKNDYTSFYHEVKGRTTTLKFYTQHSGLEAMNHTRVFVDEYTAMPYECLAIILFNCDANEVVLVGDHRQTALINEVEGISISSKIDFSELRTHELIKNYRNPSDCVCLLNTLYGYTMETTNNRLGYLFGPTTLFDRYRNTHTPLFFSYTSATHYGMKSDTGEKVTVRSNQGATFDKVVLVVCNRDFPLFNMPSMVIVALSRHRSECVILHEEGSTETFIGLLKSALPWNKRYDPIDDDTPGEGPSGHGGGGGGQGPRPGGPPQNGDGGHMPKPKDKEKKKSDDGQEAGIGGLPSSSDNNKTTKTSVPENRPPTNGAQRTEERKTKVSSILRNSLKYCSNVFKTLASVSDVFWDVGFADLDDTSSPDDLPGESDDPEMPALEDIEESAQPPFQSDGVFVSTLTTTSSVSIPQPESYVPLFGSYRPTTSATQSATLISTPETTPMAKVFYYGESSAHGMQSPAREKWGRAMTVDSLPDELTRPNKCLLIAFSESSGIDYDKVYSYFERVLGRDVLESTGETGGLSTVDLELVCMEYEFRVRIHNLHNGDNYILGNRGPIVAVMDYTTEPEGGHFTGRPNSRPASLRSLSHTSRRSRDRNRSRTRVSTGSEPVTSMPTNVVTTVATCIQTNIGTTSAQMKTSFMNIACQTSGFVPKSTIAVFTSGITTTLTSPMSDSGSYKSSTPTIFRQPVTGQDTGSPDFEFIREPHVYYGQQANLPQVSDTTPLPPLAFTVPFQLPPIGTFGVSQAISLATISTGLHSIEPEQGFTTLAPGTGNVTIHPTVYVGGQPGAILSSPDPLIATTFSQQSALVSRSISSTHVPGDPSTSHQSWQNRMNTLRIESFHHNINLRYNDANLQELIQSFRPDTFMHPDDFRVAIVEMFGISDITMDPPMDLARIERSLRNCTRDLPRRQNMLIRNMAMRFWVRRHARIAATGCRPQNVVRFSRDDDDPDDDLNQRDFRGRTSRATDTSHAYLLSITNQTLQQCRDRPRDSNTSYLGHSSPSVSQKPEISKSTFTISRPNTTNVRTEITQQQVVVEQTDPVVTRDIGTIEMDQSLNNINLQSSIDDLLGSFSSMHITERSHHAHTHHTASASSSQQILATSSTTILQPHQEQQVEVTHTAIDENVALATDSSSSGDRSLGSMLEEYHALGEEVIGNLRIRRERTIEREVHLRNKILHKFGRHIPNLRGGADKILTPLPQIDVVEPRKVPPQPLASIDESFIEMARLFSDPVILTEYLTELHDDEPDEYKPLEQTSFDAFTGLIEEFMVMDEEELMVTNQETLAYVESKFGTGIYDTTHDDQLNQRGHPKSNSEKSWSLLAVAPGVTYFKQNDMQALHCLQTRYLTKSMLVAFNYESQAKARSIADLFFNEHMELNSDVFNEQDVFMTTIESEHSMKIKNYDKQVKFDVDGEIDVRFTMKDIFKPFKTKIDLFKAGQGISAWSKDTQTIFQTAFRIINKHFINCLRPHVIYDNGVDELSLIHRVNALLSGLPSVCVNGVIDATACDSGQNNFTQAIERRILEKMGVNNDFLDWYYSYREQYVLKGYGVVAEVKGIKTSGEPATLLNNTILMAALMNYLVRGEGPCVLVIKGDDGLKRQANIVYDNLLKESMKRYLKMDFKVDIDVPITFCGYFLCGSVLLPDLLRKIFKILGHRFRDYEHFTEYQQSLRDWVLTANKLGVNDMCMIASFCYNLEFEYCLHIFEAIVSLSHISKKQFYDTFKRRHFDWVEATPNETKWSEKCEWYSGPN